MRIFNINDMIRVGGYMTTDWGLMNTFFNWLNTHFSYNNNDFKVGIVRRKTELDVWILTVRDDDDAIVIKLSWPGLVEISQETYDSYIMEFTVV